jgi:hypothetical protein
MSREDPAVLELTLTKTVNKGATFNLCLYERFRAADVLVRVEVAPKAGEEDQGGGVVWRVKGTNDYYVARWNPLEANLRAYRVVKGKREMLSSAKVETGGAKTRRVLTVRSQGASHEVWLDGVKLLGFTDSALKEAGLTGLWTKADAATSFSGFTVSQVD